MSQAPPLRCNQFCNLQRRWDAILKDANAFAKIVARYGNINAAMWDLSAAANASKLSASIVIYLGIKSLCTRSGVCLAFIARKLLKGFGKITWIDTSGSTIKENRRTRARSNSLDTFVCLAWIGSYRRESVVFILIYLPNWVKFRG